MVTIDLSRRERQIMDIIYRLEKATANEVMGLLPKPPSYSAVRAMVRILEDKGHLQHIQEGPRYVYSSTVAPEKASRSALRHVMSTFFNDSAAQAMAALLDEAAAELSAEDLDRLSLLIETAKSEGR